MLMNEFYTISEVQQGEASISGIINFSPDHEIFSGHFPGQPVVPGVCMMQIVKELLQGHLHCKLLLKATGQVKFLQLLAPDTKPEVSISWQVSNSTYIVNAVFRNGGDAFKLGGTYEIV